MIIAIFSDCEEECVRRRICETIKLAGNRQSSAMEEDGIESTFASFSRVKGGQESRASQFVDMEEDKSEGSEEEGIQLLGKGQKVESETESSAARCKMRRKAGRKAIWPIEAVEEVARAICENETYRKRLIFTKNKASTSFEIYTEIVLQLKDRMQERQKALEFSPEQTRNKFKSCILACKKASMTRRNGSGIKNFMQHQPAWFQKLFAYVESKDSCNPDLTDEPSYPNFARRTVEDTSSSAEEHEGSTYTTPRNKKKRLYVPVHSKKKKKETPSQLLKEAVQHFNNLASQDPTDALVAFFKEENEKGRAHEREMATMQMQMLQMMMMMVPGQARPSFPCQIENHYNHHGSHFQRLENTEELCNAGNQGSTSNTSWISFLDSASNSPFFDKK